MELATQEAPKGFWKEDESWNRLTTALDRMFAETVKYEKGGTTREELTTEGRKVLQEIRDEIAASRKRGRGSLTRST